jgi:cytochrome d ubiquinol oxidase subunit II
MPTVWFAILALMLTAYAVLDGFDFGAGILHLLVAKTDAERRTVISAIKPFWGANEVWLISAGGVFVFAFPRAFGAAFSGLYLPLTLVIWLVVLRGLSIEMRSQLRHSLWRRGFDVIFAASSATMAIVLGVALANVIRGVPLDGSGYFHEDLFGGGSGALDGYTISMGVFALVALSAHGATFLAWKTEDALQARCVRWATHSYRALLVLVVVATALTFVLVPSFFALVLGRPSLWPLPIAGLAAGAWVLRSLSRDRVRAAFLASCGFIACFLVATAAALFPTILRSSVAPAYSIDTSSATSSHALAIGFRLWIIGITLVVLYFTYLFRSLRGKATADEEHAPDASHPTDIQDGSSGNSLDRR